MAQQLPNQWQSQPVQGQLPYQQQGMFMTTQPNAAPGYLPPQQVALGTGVRVQPERDYNYVPQDFRSLTLLTMLFCGVFSPLTFMFTIPALIYATKSRASAERGATKEARSQGMVAAYLNIVAVLFALVLAIILTGLVIGLHGKTWARDRCVAEATSDGRLPRLTRSSYEYISSQELDDLKEGDDKDRKKRSHTSRRLRRVSCL